MKMLVADLDSTLAESKQPMTLEMAALLERVLLKVPMSVISGGAYSQFEKQFLGSLPLPDQLLEKLYLFPTSGAAFYRFSSKKWNKIYAEELSEEEKKAIFKAFEICFEELDFKLPKKPLYGPILEDRLSQVTFSALGQQAPLNLKEKWDPYLSKRFEMIEILQKHLIDFDIRAGGSTSIDVSRKGRDKSYGISKMCEMFNLAIADLVMIGDRFDKHGNDAPVQRMGVKCYPTTGPSQTMTIIENLLLEME